MYFFRNLLIQKIKKVAVKKNVKSDFTIKIDFDKQSENPSRVFETMANLIKSFQDFDKDLIKSVDSKIEPILLLENVETGSLKTMLVSILKGIPDEAIKEMDWKKIVGDYLLKAKYIVLNRLSDKMELTDAQVIEDIQYEIIEEAEKTDVKLFPSYAQISPQKLLKNIDKINKALEPLSEDDSAVLISKHGQASFNLQLDFSTDDIEDLITKEKHQSESTMILKVKKPDYLGNSMWDFKHGSKSISAKIVDAEWLNDFQKRKIDIRPGDSLRARVMTTIKYGYELTLVGLSYEITKIEEVIRFVKGKQITLDLPDEE